MKKYLSLLIVALVLCIAASAATSTGFYTEAVAEPEEEELTYISADEAVIAENAVYAKLNDFICYVRYNIAKLGLPSSNNNDGLTPDTPKSGLGAPDGNGVCSLLVQNNGGTLVANGRFLIGANYTFEGIEDGVIKITGNDGTTDYKNTAPHPDEDQDLANPLSGAMKFNKNKNLTFKNDAIIDDIILFNQEDNYSPTISITNGCTLVMGDKIVSMTRESNAIPTHISLYVEEGSTLIVKGGKYNSITGGGKVYIADSVEVAEVKTFEIKVDENGMIVAPVVTAPVIVTAPVVTSTIPTVTPIQPEETTFATETQSAPETEAVSETEEVPDVTDVVDTTEPVEETTSPEDEKTDAPEDEDKDKDKDDEEDEDDEKSDKEDGVNTTAIIIAAIIAGAVVIIVIAIVVLLIVKKKH